MFKKMRFRFIIVTMTCISFIFALILLVLNLFMTFSSQNQGYKMLEDYASRKFYPEENMDFDAPAPPKLPPFMKNRWFNDNRIFFVQYDSAGAITQLSIGNNPELSEEALSTMADKALQKSGNNGSLSGYLYLKDNAQDGTRIFFLDYTPENDMSGQLLQVCLWIGLAGIIVILIPVIFLSKWVTRPVQLAFNKQKQFIADASHELKTPLTIITTTTEVLEGSLPDNKWLSHILEQTTRMKSLINSLLDLARLDSYNEKQSFVLFDLGKAINHAALSFESIAYEQEKQFTIEIEKPVMFEGNEVQIRQLVSILLDNAFKYSNEQDEVLIRLSSHGNKKKLLIHNTGKGIPAEDQKRIFERFYRSDSSRSREFGGYGLGLSIAQSIVEVHQGHISVNSDGATYTDFVIILP